MSDKNPYYSIPKALGERTEEIEMLPLHPDMSMMIELRERIDRMFQEAFCPPIRRQQTALAYRSGQFVSLPIDDNGNVVEPSPRCPHCGPILCCPKHCCAV